MYSTSYHAYHSQNALWGSRWKGLPDVLQSSFISFPLYSYLVPFKTKNSTFSTLSKNVPPTTHPLPLHSKNWSPTNPPCYHFYHGFPITIFLFCTLWFSSMFLHHSNFTTSRLHMSISAAFRSLHFRITYSWYLNSWSPLYPARACLTNQCSTALITLECLASSSAALRQLLLFILGVVNKLVRPWTPRNGIFPFPKLQHWMSQVPRLISLKVLCLFCGAHPALLSRKRPLVFGSHITSKTPRYRWIHWASPANYTCLACNPPRRLFRPFVPFLQSAASSSKCYLTTTLIWSALSP